MRSIRTAIVAIVAIAGFSALATSSAFAAPEWYAKKAGVYAKITKAVKVEAKSTIEVSEETFIGHELGQGPVIIACSASVGGSVGPGGAGEIARVENISCKCTIEWPGITKNNCTLEGGVDPFDLAWSTELYSEGSEIRSKIAKGNGGLPEWEWKYKNSGVGEEKLTCNFNTSTHMGNNATTGGVEAEFDKKSNKTTCEQGEKETAEWKGVMKIVPTESEKKAGIEAIKVE